MQHLAGSWICGRKFKGPIIKTNWIGHFLRINYLFHDVIEVQMTEVKGVGRRRRTRRTQLLDDLRKRIRYWELKKEAED